MISDRLKVDRHTWKVFIGITRLREAGLFDEEELQVTIQPGMIMLSAPVVTWDQIAEAEKKKGLKRMNELLKKHRPATENDN